MCFVARDTCNVTLRHGKSHIWVVDAHKTMKRARALNIDLQKAKLDGLRFQVAMKQATVDMREFSSSAPEKISTDIIDDCLNLLRRSLLVTDNTE